MLATDTDVVNAPTDQHPLRSQIPLLWLEASNLDYDPLVLHIADPIQGTSGVEAGMLATDCTDTSSKICGQNVSNLNGVEVSQLSLLAMSVAQVPLVCQIPLMPPKKHRTTNGPVDYHKTTIVLPTELHQDLRFLVTLKPNGTIRALVERGGRDLIERERGTLEKLRQFKVERVLR